MPFTKQDIELLKQKAKIRGYTITPVKRAGNVPVATKSKYGNKKVEFDGITFDSKKEMGCYLSLRMMEKAWAITDLKLQVPFELNPGGTHSLKYVADFTYIENGQLKVVDAKGYKTKVYRKKEKLMLQVHGIKIIEL